MQKQVATFLWLLACSRSSSPYIVPEGFFILRSYSAQFAKGCIWVNVCLVFGPWSWNTCANSNDWLKSWWLPMDTGSYFMSYPRGKLETSVPCWKGPSSKCPGLGAKPHCLSHTVKPKLSSVYGSSLLLEDHNSLMLLAGELSCTGHCITVVV